MVVVKTKRTLGSTTLQIPIAGIIGIAVGGAVLLFGILVAIILVVVRRKHRREKGRISKLEDGARVGSGMKRPEQRTIPAENESTASNSFSHNPFMPLDNNSPYHDWTGRDGLHGFIGTKPRRSSSQKPLFMISGMRDSWPLVSNIPMSLMPKQSSSSIILSNVAAPGYEIPSKPTRPKRTPSRRTMVLVPRDTTRIRSKSNERYSPSKSPRRPKPHRRSTSENHLSTILRSTSERLKAANKSTLTRTLTTVNRDSNAPTFRRLSTTLDLRIPTESREQLIESDHESVASSVYDLARSLSMNNQSPRKPAKLSTPERKSPVSLAESEDSLCAGATPDLIIPAQLASPSKKEPNGPQRHRMRISSGAMTNLSTSALKDNGNLFPLSGKQANMRRSISLSTPRQGSISGDPFFSEVRSAKPLIPNGQIQFPRPLYIRKATFGEVSVSSRPRSTVNVLADISGNAQATPNKPVPPPHSASPVSIRSDQNPFQWAPQEAMQTRSTQSSPTRRRGHKRSKVVRISQLPRPCSVAVVPEEPDEEGSPLKLRVPSSPPLQLDEPIKSPTPAVITVNDHGLSERPPSSAVFNPTLNAYDLTGRSRDNSPTLGMDEIYSMYSSPTLGANYYTESSDASEDDFFAKKSTTQSHTKSSSPRYSRTYSNELFLFPATPPGKLVSFPDSELSLEERIIAPPSTSPRPLPSITTIFAPPHMPSKTATPAPPLLTIPIPGHLTGPRAEPAKSSTFSPTQNSLQTSIGMLRRMNSEVSQSSFKSSPSAPQFSQMPGRVSIANFASITAESSPIDDQEERGRTRGSKHYLTLGDGNAFPYPSSSSHVRSPHRPRRSMEKRDSHRIYKERRKQRIEGIENDIASGMINELTPVKEMSSPATSNSKVILSRISPSRVVAASDVSLSTRHMKGSSIKTEDFVDGIISEREADADDEEEEEKRSEPRVRWSDAMAKPVNHVIRRESKMEHPTPKSPPTWGWGLGIMYSGQGSSGEGLISEDTGAKKYEILAEGKENKNMNGSNRPGSLGLYDQDGFLRGSPERGG